MFDYSFLFYDRYVDGEDSHNIRLWDLVSDFEDQLDSLMERKLRESGYTAAEMPLEDKLDDLAPEIFDELFKPRIVTAMDALIEGREITCWEDLKPYKQERLKELCSTMYADAIRRLKNAVFFYFWSRDCDQAESDHAYRFSGWYKASEYIQSFYENLEGPGHCEPMDLTGYLAFEASFYDHRAAQYNY
jgi:hypothetical protein